MADGSAAEERPSEFALIARYFAPIAGAAGLGLLDDAAVVLPPPGCELVLTKDMVAAGVHFFPDDPPASIARKALRVNLSDLAAKGATPLGFLLGLALPAAWRVTWLEAFAAALGEDSRAYGCPLLGGDTIRAAGGLTIAITAFGHVPAGGMLRRDGAQAGDRLVVTGTIGDGALGLLLRADPDVAWARDLEEAERAHLIDRYLHPRPRNAVAAHLRAAVHAALDISDGLVADTAKLAQHGRGGDGLALVGDLAALPLSRAARKALAADPALLDTIATGGDDYEVAAAVPEAALPALAAACAAAGVGLTPVGRFLPLSADTASGWRDASGKVRPFARGGYVHA